MDFEKKLNELNQYNVTFEIRQGYYHVSLIFDDNWEIVAADNEAIHIEKRNGICHYIGHREEVKINEIFDAINETIEYNIDLEKKLALFKEKTEELQDIFAKEDYEILKTIKFIFMDNEPKPKPKKRGRKPKQDKEEKNEAVEQDLETTTITKNMEKEEEIVNNIEELNEVNSNCYDDDEEIVTMTDGFIEELERK